MYYSGGGLSSPWPQQQSGHDHQQRYQQHQHQKQQHHHHHKALSDDEGTYQALSVIYQDRKAGATASGN